MDDAPELGDETMSFDDCLQILSRAQESPLFIEMFPNAEKYYKLLKREHESLY